MAKVLIIDDDEGSRRLATLSLGPDHACASVSTGGEGLATLSGSHPDLIILDLLLLDVDGLTFLGSAKQLGYFGPVLLVSAIDRHSPVLEKITEELGPDAVLLKPYDPEELVTRVELLLGGRPALAAGS